VKNFFRRGSFEETVDENPFETIERKSGFKIITRKPTVPAAEEMKRNSRSRSAKLRIAEKE
jgi:16S rRNA (cytosine1402-N4)-methyltransferase